MTDSLVHLDEIERLARGRQFGTISPQILSLIAALREARERIKSIEMNTGCMRGPKERGTQFCAEALDLSAQLREARKALEDAFPLLDWLKSDADELTCGDVCDKTFEFQGCIGPCSLDTSRAKLDKWLRENEHRRALKGASDGE